MRGMKWITKMVMEMVLVLTLVLMETPEGGWRSLPEVIPAAFPPSDLLRRQPSVFCFVCFVFLRRLLAKLLGGLFL
jgi:hypothetical protein